MKDAQRRRFRGQSMVEFALVAPILFMLVFGVIELGRFVWTHHELANGTREGARLAMVRGSESTDPLSSWTVIEERILARTRGLSNDDLTVTGTGLGGDPGTNVTVRSTYRYTPIIGFIPGLRTVNITATSTVIIQH